MTLENRSHRPVQRSGALEPTIEILATTTVAYVKRNSPTTNFGSPNFFIVEYQDGNKGTDLFISFGKFTKLGTGTYFQMIFTNPLVYQLQSQHTHTSNGGLTNLTTRFELKLYKITEDFDTSTIVFNDFAGLAKTFVGRLVWAITTISQARVLGQFVAWSSQPAFADPTHNEVLVVGGNTVDQPGKLDFDGAFGWALEYVLNSGGGNDGNLAHYHSDNISDPDAVKPYLIRKPPGVA